MAAVTSSYRSLNARWFWELANEKRSLFVGVSKTPTTQTIMIDGKPVVISDLDVNDNDGDDAISKCDFFVRAEAHFAKESNASDYNIKILTRQAYTTTPNKLTNEHNFIDVDCYWKYITPEQALAESCYNIVFTFSLDNQDESKYAMFRNLKHFYVFDELLYNNTEIEDDFIEKDLDANFTAGNIIIIDDFVALSVPDKLNSRIKYLISF